MNSTRELSEEVIDFPPPPPLASHVVGWDGARLASDPRVIAAREDEARRIARELHDEAGQLLSAAFLSLAQLAPELSPSGRERLLEAQELLQAVERRLRTLSHELHPALLRELGLKPALELLASGVSERAGLPVVVQGSTGGRLAPLVEITAYRIAKEALTNVIRHARAASAAVKLERRDDLLLVRTRDDGIGFDATAFADGRAGGLGLSGIRERLRALAGRLLIRSFPGRGTELVAEIPLGASSWAPASS